jgi:hypothetical protein
MATVVDVTEAGEGRERSVSVVTEIKTAEPEVFVVKNNHNRGNRTRFWTILFPVAQIRDRDLLWQRSPVEPTASI